MLAQVKNSDRFASDIVDVFAGLPGRLSIRFLVLVETCQLAVSYRVNARVLYTECFVSGLGHDR